jgi:hypothetical protein
VVDCVESYGDESGISGGKVCSVISLVGSSAQWRLVEDRWRRVCKDIVFHAKDFFHHDNKGNRTGVYAGWSDERARRFLEELYNAIGTELRLVGGIVRVKDFNALSPGERKYFTLAPFDPRTGKWLGTGAPSRPWFLGFSTCVINGALYVKKPDLKIHFWFDRQNEFEGLANEMFQRAVERGIERVRPKLGNLVFAPKDEYPGLQAADLVAFTGGSWHQRLGPKNLDHQYSVTRLQAFPRQNVIDWNALKMETALRGVPPHVRAVWDTAKLKGEKRSRPAK